MKDARPVAKPVETKEKTLHKDEPVKVPKKHDKLLEERRAEFQKYDNDKEHYKDVAFNQKTGGLKATHKEHNFDPKTGWYEKDVQEAGFLQGHSVILGKESQNEYHKKSNEGLWNNKPFEIAGAETATSNNIRNALKHCASKPGTRIAVLYFPNENFTSQAFNEGLAKYEGLSGTSQYKKFDMIICIHGKTIVQTKKPSS